MSTDTFERPSDMAAPANPDDPFLIVEDLTVKFPTHDGLVQAVTDLSYTVERGKTLGIVGESGSGKSVSSMAVLGLHDPKHTRLSGSIRVNGQEVIGAPEDHMRKIRGNSIAMIFQDALTALHPFYTIGDQISEGYRLHHKVSKADAKKRAIEMLDRVGIPQANRRVDDYPHQYSGGMRQRAMIAMSLVNDPQLLIADEPTTALDVTVQAQVLVLLTRLRQEHTMAILLITHDLAVVAETADRVVVMYAGQVMETGEVPGIFDAPRHPYTRALLEALPEHNFDRARLRTIPGVVPGAFDRPGGCLLAPRCAFAVARCVEERPALRGDAARAVRCHFPL